MKDVERQRAGAKGTENGIRTEPSRKLLPECHQRNATLTLGLVASQVEFPQHLVAWLCGRHVASRYDALRSALSRHPSAWLRPCTTGADGSRVVTTSSRREGCGPERPES